MTTVLLPAAVTESTARYGTDPYGLTLPQRFSDATTSSAVSIWPLWKGTLLRRLIVYVSASLLTVYPVARSGWGRHPASNANSSSKIGSVITAVRVAVVAGASSVNGSPISATFSVPPRRSAGAASAAGSSPDPIVGSHLDAAAPSPAAVTV